MSDLIKLIVPLIDDSLTMEDFSEDTGFIDGYIENINHPSLTNHTFLLYDGQLDTIAKLERDAKMRHIPSLYSRTIVHISGIPYMLYTFCNMKKGIERIREGMVPYKEDEFMRIQKFWKLKDDFVNSFIINRARPFEHEGFVLPEEDYVPEIGDEFDIVI